MTINLQASHRIILGSMAALIFGLQTSAIFYDLDNLNGIDWVLAYVASAILLSVSLYKTEVFKIVRQWQVSPVVTFIFKLFVSIIMPIFVMLAGAVIGAESGLSDSQSIRFIFHLMVAVLIPFYMAVWSKKLDGAIKVLLAFFIPGALAVITYFVIDFLGMILVSTFPSMVMLVAKYMGPSKVIIISMVAFFTTKAIIDKLAREKIFNNA